MPVVVRVGDNWYHLRAVLDTGATHTVIAFNALLGNDVNVEKVKGLVKKLDEYVREKGMSQVVIKGATEDSDVCKTYAYAVCFDNAFVGGHLMRKFHARVMINGASNVSVIGNDFLNMCDYQHTAGEHRLLVKNPDEQKYYEYFNRKNALSNEQLNILFLEKKDKKVEVVLEEDFTLESNNMSIF